RANKGPLNPVDSFRYKVEERIECSQSRKVRYTQREDNILSLGVPLEAILNKDSIQTSFVHAAKYGVLYTESRPQYTMIFSQKRSMGRDIERAK
ncbi:Ubiquitin carboxyl-terminal hydrolase 13, partial [Exaiptasia diaphana]